MNVEAAWELQANGQYKALTRTEDLISESKALFEDLRHSIYDLALVRRDALATSRESRALIEGLRRKRRLRDTKLHLVRTNE